MKRVERFWAMGFGSLAASLFLLVWLLNGPVFAQGPTCPSTTQGPCTGCINDCLRWLLVSGTCPYQYSPTCVYDTSSPNCNLLGVIDMSCAEKCSYYCSPPSEGSGGYDCSSNSCTIPTGENLNGQVTSYCDNSCWGKFCGDPSAGTQCGEYLLEMGGPFSTNNVACGCTTF